VYTCILLQEHGSQTIISVASLAVKPQTPSISTRETRPIQLYCQSELLSYIYKDLTQRWEVNGTLWKDYGFTTLAAVSGVLIKKVLFIHFLLYLTAAHYTAALLCRLGSLRAPSKILNICICNCEIDHTTLNTLISSAQIINQR
jgi:hypothetical protein